MNSPIAIFLCDESGVMAEPWAEAGIECFCVDLEHSIRKDRKVGLINFVWGDCRTWIPPARRKIIFAGAFPPCTHTANSGARDFAKKRGMLLRDALESEAYTKATCLRVGGGFVMPDKKRIDAVLGSKMHLLPPSDDRQAERSKTPQGFSRAVFKANFQQSLRIAA